MLGSFSPAWRLSHSSMVLCLAGGLDPGCAGINWALLQLQSEGLWLQPAAVHTGYRKLQSHTRAFGLQVKPHKLRGRK